MTPRTTRSLERHESLKQERDALTSVEGRKLLQVLIGHPLGPASFVAFGHHLRDVTSRTDQRKAGSGVQVAAAMWLLFHDSFDAKEGLE